MQTARLAGVDRIQLTLLAALLVTRRMSGMHAGPGTDPGTLGFYTGSGAVTV